MPYLNPNEIGFIAAVTGVVALRRIPDAGTAKLKYLYFASLVTSLVALFFAQARTSTVAFTLMVIVSGIVIRRLRWVSVAAIIATLSLLAYFLVTGRSLGIEDTVLQYLERGVSEENLETMSGRTVLWDIGWTMFLDAPLFGHGFEAGVRFSDESYGLWGAHMHNAHMQVLVNSGALGYLLWVSMVIAVSVLLIKMRKHLNLTVATEAGRFHFEILLVMGITWIRTVTGSVLVFHQYSLLIFMAMMVYIALTLKSARTSDRAALAGATQATLEMNCSAGRILARKRRLL
jgi:O-antigen ligase